jgi:hypothetical protein
MPDDFITRARVAIRLASSTLAGERFEAGTANSNPSLRITTDVPWKPTNRPQKLLPSFVVHRTAGVIPSAPTSWAAQKTLLIATTVASSVHPRRIVVEKCSCKAPAITVRAD